MTSHPLYSVLDIPLWHTAWFRRHFITTDIRFAFFSKAFIAASAVHYVKEWNEPSIAIILVLLSLFSFIALREIFTLFLVSCISIVVTIGGFPRLANHTTITLFISVLIAMVFIVSLLRRSPPNLSIIITSLRGLAVLLYFFVGFHKINSDFLDPVTSCSTWYHEKVERTFVFLKINVPDFVIKLSPIYVVAAELCSAILLFFRRTWMIGLLMALPIHIYVSLSGFTDFSMLAHAIIILFIPNRIFQIENPQIKVRTWVSRGIGIYIILIIIYYATSTYVHMIADVDRYTISSILGIVTIFSSFELIFLIAITAYWLHSKPNFSVYSKQPHARSIFSNLFIASFFLWGIFPYIFGSQTSLTMFSNLATEKTRSNHLLINTKFTKLIDFEKNLISVDHIHTKVRPPSRYEIQGYLLPESEFRYIASISSKKLEHKISLDIMYRGKNMYIEDLANSQFSNKPISSRFLTFRQIDPIGPAKCRW